MTHDSRPSLYEPVRIGAIDMANCIAMAPLTRSRAAEGLVPSPMAAEYYGQRATAGLIITEATQVSLMAQGYISTPGLYTPAQVAGWK
ncbi:MAG TPA: alkene reductase, partial [Rhodanobacteraceae bacterium]